MSLLDRVVTGKIKKPKKILVYGSQGVGKTYLASRFPNTLFISTEEGTNELDVARVHLSDYKEVILACREVAESEYGTVVIDSADWFEKIIEQDLEKEQFKTDYGKGQVETARRFGKLMDALDICIENGKTVILIAHQEIRKAEDFRGAMWDQIRPKLSKRACERVMEWCDVIGHVRFEDSVRQEEGSFGQTRGIASTTGRRIVVTKAHPAYLAKSRVELPASVSTDEFYNYFGE